MNRNIAVAIVVGLMMAGAWPGDGPAPARAQDASGVERVKSALPAGAALTFEQTVTAAGRLGLPTAPLVDKALEGLAKGMPADRILAVLHQLSSQLGRAQALLGGAGAGHDADIAAVADALQRGVPEGAVRTLRGTAPAGESVAMPVHTLADLLDRGVPVNVALDVLSAWRAQGADAVDLRELPAAVELLIRHGVLPTQAAEAVAAAVRAGRRPAGAGPPLNLGNPGQIRGKAPDRPPLPPGLGPDQA